MAKVKDLVLDKYADALVNLCAGINEVKPQLQDVKSGYLSMETYVAIVHQLNTIVNNAYYEGNEEKADYYICKVEALCKEMRMFNRNFGL